MLTSFRNEVAGNGRRGSIAERRPVWLRLEELEARSLLSASGLSSFVAQPQMQILPLDATARANPLTPAVVRHAYGIDRLPYDGTGQTIAVVGAFDDPTVAPDLIRFSATFGLTPFGPPGGTNLPVFTLVKAAQMDSPPNNGWTFETALDVEWVHAIAPKANILLVEAQNDSGTALMQAVETARNTPGVSVVSMSWGASEFDGETYYDNSFTTPQGHKGGNGVAGGITFVAASGDHGAWGGATWPSVSPNVLGVGGTTLYLNGDSSYNVETGWSGSGGGYSNYEVEPAFQRSAQHIGVRSAPDIAYNADPNTGYYVINAGVWYQMGGTSAGTPQWAALIALADQGRGNSGSIANAQALLYALPASDFHQPTSGNNGYAARGNYNPVTGRGTPRADLLIPDLVGAAGAVAASATSKAATSGNSGSVHILATRTVPIDVVRALLDGGGAGLALAAANPTTGNQPVVDTSVHNSKGDALWSQPVLINPGVRQMNRDAVVPFVSGAESSRDELEWDGWDCLTSDAI